MSYFIASTEGGTRAHLFPKKPDTIGDIYPFKAYSSLCGTIFVRIEHKKDLIDQKGVDCRTCLRLIEDKGIPRKHIGREIEICETCGQEIRELNRS